jgi:hypothetical protein
MPISGTFGADFSAFQTAVDGAVTKLITFEDNATKVKNALGKMEESFSGKTVIQNATLMAEAIERAGGIAALTGDELATAGAKAQEAAEKMRALGITVPENIQAVADAAAKADTSTKSLSVSVLDMVKAYVSAEAILGAAKAAWAAVTDQVTESIGAANEAEKAHVQLLAALHTQGTDMPSVISAYEGYASALQKTTIYQDDAIEGAEALLVQIGGVMPKDMQAALTATTNLASGLGIDLHTATLMVAKAAEGNTTALGKTGVVLDETRVKAEGFGYVLDTINDKFSGQAAAVADTYAGRLTQLANTWNNVQESIGRVITQNATVLKAIDLVNQAIDSNTGELKDNQTATDLVSLAVISAAKAMGFLIEAGNFLQTEFEDLRVFADKTAQGFLDLGIAALKTGIAVADFRSHIDPSTWNPQFQASLADAKTALAGMQGAYKNLATDIASAGTSQKDWSDKLGGLNTQIDGFVAELEKTRGKTKEVTAAANENSDAWNRNTVNQKANAEAAKKAHDEEEAFWKEYIKFYEEEIGKTAKTWQKAQEDNVKAMKLVNDAILAELDAQVKLNAAQGLDAMGAIKLQSTALDDLNTKLAALHANKVQNISQEKEEQVLMQQYSTALYNEAVAEDKKQQARIDASNRATEALKSNVQQVADATALTYQRALNDYTKYSQDQLEALRDAANAAAQAVSDAATRAAQHADDAFKSFHNTIVLDTTDLQTLNQELTKFYDKLAAQGNVGMMGPNAGVGMPGAGTGAGMGRIPSFGEGGSGDFGSGTVAMLHGKEAVVPLDDNGSNILYGGAAGLSHGATVNLTVNVTQPLGTPDQIARAVGEAQISVLKGQGIRLPYGA